jgi:hypothetical protein
MMADAHKAALGSLQSKQDHGQSLEQGEQGHEQALEQGEQSHGQQLEQIKATPKPAAKAA